MAVAQHSEIPTLLEVAPGSMKREEVDKVQSNFHSMYDKNEDKNLVEKRKENYYTVTKSYYDLVTDFYEYGWGQSFHFAPRTRRETFDMAIARHEMHLAQRIKMEAGKRYLDTGCGVGGPQRQMTTFVRGAHIVGLNLDSYQIERAKMHTALAKLSDQCSYVEGDFMKMPFEANTFDGGYNCESLCHAPDKLKCYSEIFRVMKPGAYFASLEWAVTPKYDPNNEYHRKLKHEIEIGDALPELGTYADHTDAWKAAGFELVEARDMVDNRDHMIPWYQTLVGQYNLQNFRHTWLGRAITHNFVTVLESTGLAPKGTVKVHSLLCTAASALAEGGRLEIFTPMYFVLVRKPE
eukprot:comp21637_c0_seq1/m.30397 comp21637_c0_seq1/g.30397  ORF comp21637_c0_seq1/g.30397 comp21637_c0_seq1/m.30397 type:complete len:350 (-) comp21637_c0_seq1:564-1613(-)